MQGISMHVEQNKKNHKRFFALLGLLLLCCFVRYTFQINIPQVVFLGISFLMAVTGDPDEIIAMCMCCIPLHNFFEFAFAILFGIICYVVKYGNRIRLNRSVIPVILMVLWELLHCFGIKVNIMQFGGHTVAWIMIAVLMCSSKENFDYDFIVRAFALTIVIMCITLIGKVLYVSNFDFAKIFVNMQRLGMETEEAKASLQVEGAQINPNTLGILCVLGIIGLIQLRMAGRGKAMDIFSTVAMLLFGVMTSSRTYLVCLLFMALLLLFSTKGSLIRKFRNLLIILLFAALVLLLAYLIMPNVIEYFYDRFFVSDITTGRMDILGVYNDFIISKPKICFWGIGLQNFDARVLDLCTQAWVVPHNMFQELIIAWGLPGLVLIAALWISMIVRSKKMCRKQGLLNYIPLLIIIFKSQAGQMINSSYTMLTLSLAYLSMCTNLTSGEEASDEKPAVVDAAPGVEFGRALEGLIGKVWIIVLAAIVCGTGAYAVTHFAVTPLYESSAKFYVNNVHVIKDDERNYISFDSLWVSRNLVGSYKVIVKSRSLLNDVIEYTGVNRTYEEVEKMISSTSVNETEIFEVTVTSADPAEAEKIANGIAALLPERIEGIIDGTSTHVVEYAVIAAQPSSPNKISNAMVGAVFGGVLIVMIILTDAMTNRTIRRQSDIEYLGQYPLLTVIPDLAGGEARKRNYYEKRR